MFVGAKSSRGMGKFMGSVRVVNEERCGVICIIFF